MDKFTLIIEKGIYGLWYITSPQIKGLLVAHEPLGAALEAVPKAIADLGLIKQEGGDV